MTTYPAIEAEFLLAKKTKGDIDEHLDYLYDLAIQCDSVVEGGLRYCISCWAFILGCACRGGVVQGHCWNRLKEITRTEEICKANGLNWTYFDGDWLTHDIPSCDLLMVDTNHTYEQLTAELRRHGPKARRWIVLHDTESFRDVGTDGKPPGMWQAVLDFIAEGEWEIINHRAHQNGLTTLGRKQPCPA